LAGPCGNGSRDCPYVVKLFEPAFVEERDPVANEVIGNTLAREFGLPVPKAALIDQWKERFYRYHLFYDFLKGSSQPSKSEYFHEFEEYLRRLDLKVLDSFFSQLESIGYSARRHEVVRRYLAEMKGKSVNFVSLLKGLIS
jgi:hypothetical protein